MAKARTILFWCLGLLVLGALAYVVLGYTARAVAEMKVKELLAGMEDVADAEYRKVDVDLLDLSATVRDLKVAVIGGVEFRVGKLKLFRFEQLDGMPRSMKMSARSVHIPLSQEALAGSSDTFRELGFDAIGLDYDLDFDYDPKTREFRLHELRIDLRHGGELSMKLALGNVDLAALLEGGPKIAFMAIERGEMRYEDHSLVERIFTSLAREEGTTADEVRSALIEELAEREAAATQANDEFSVATLAALQSFLAKPGAISLHADPLGGVAIMQLMALDDPVDMLKALDLHFDIEEVLNQ